MSTSKRRTPAAAPAGKAASKPVAKPAGKAPVKAATKAVTKVVTKAAPKAAAKVASKAPARVAKATPAKVPRPGTRGPRSAVSLEQTVAKATPQNAHIVAIRRGEVIEGHQLRVGNGGAGMTKFFSSSKYGGPDKARKAALKMIRDLDLPKPRKRGGSVAGRLLKTSKTPAAGIRFLWSRNEASPRLRVAATWMDRKGRPRHTSFSVDRNGLESALDMAIERRTSCGAPTPDREALLKALKKVKKAGPDAA
jgi:hypothetical protein